MSGDQPAVLTSALLDELERAMHRVGAPMPGSPTTGLTDDQIDVRIDPLPFSLSDEARLWWKWRGSEPDRGVAVRRPSFGPQVLHLGLDDAINAFDQSLQGARATAASDVTAGVPELMEPGYWWEPRWFPIAQTSSSVVALVLEAEPVPAAPVLHVDWANAEDRSDWATPISASLGQLVSWWIEALDSGIWIYDGRAWDTHVWERAPQRAHTGLF